MSTGSMNKKVQRISQIPKWEFKKETSPKVFLQNILQEK